MHSAIVVSVPSGRWSRCSRSTLTVPELTRARTSLALELYADKEKIGTLIIGQGSLFWRGGKRSSEWIDWTIFAEMMNEKVYGEKASASS